MVKNEVLTILNQQIEKEMLLKIQVFHKIIVHL